MVVAWCSAIRALELHKFLVQRGWISIYILADLTSTKNKDMPATRQARAHPKSQHTHGPSSDRSPEDRLPAQRGSIQGRARGTSRYNTPLSPLSPPSSSPPRILPLLLVYYHTRRPPLLPATLPIPKPQPKFPVANSPIRGNVDPNPRSWGSRVAATMMFTEGLDESAISWIKQGTDTPPAPAAARSPLAERLPLGQISEGAAAPRSPALYNRACVGLFSPKSLPPPVRTATRHSGLLCRHSVLLAADSEEEEEGEESVASWGLTEDCGYGYFSDHTAEEDGVCSSDSSLFRRARDLYGNGVEDEVTSQFRRRAAGLHGGSPRRTFGSRCEPRPRPRLPGEAPLVRIRWTAARVLHRCAYVLAKVASNSNYYFHIQQRYVDTQKFQDFGPPSAPPIARDGEEKIIRSLLGVQIADENGGFKKTEISSVADILAQDVHELPSKKDTCCTAKTKLRATSSFRNLYMQAGSEYVRQISKILKSQVTMLTSTSSTSLPEEMFTCTLELKSSRKGQERDSVSLQYLKPGTGESQLLRNHQMVPLYLGSRMCGQNSACLNLSTPSDNYGSAKRSILLDCEDRINVLLAIVFENYKSLDEHSITGLSELFGPISDCAAPALAPAVQIFSVLHDILSNEAQSILRSYLQTAAAKRCRRHMIETDEFMSSNNDNLLTDEMTISAAYLKMKTLCINISLEIQADIKIHNQNILPSPPSRPLQHVAELLIATADFERDLDSWQVRPVHGGVLSRELFHDYIMVWIEDTRLHLLDYCKAEKLSYPAASTTSPFVEQVYEQIKESIHEYGVVINRWPQYLMSLESAIADVEREVMKALEKQYMETLMPLRDGIPKILEKHVQRLTRRQSVAPYVVPNQLGTFMNTVKRMLDVLHCRVEEILKSWAAYLTIANGTTLFGEQMNSITVMLRKKYKKYLQAIVEKIVSETQANRTTRLKRILEETKETEGESEMRERMQALRAQLSDSIHNLHGVFSCRIFVAICRGFWDRLGQTVLRFLESRKENRIWYRGSDYALGILDDVFASEMQKLLGNALQDKDLDPPQSVIDARSILC
ncbi:hypothetical protein D1007_10280 [Hordeum vulgare]|nr:hypothetical protein D1007_10280 [Hordeum vulgare]